MNQLAYFPVQQNQGIRRCTSMSNNQECVKSLTGCFSPCSNGNTTECEIEIEADSISRNNPTIWTELETIFNDLWINCNRWIKRASSTKWADEKEVLLDLWVSEPQNTFYILEWTVNKRNICLWNGRRFDNFCNHKFNFIKKNPVACLLHKNFLSFHSNL